MIRFIRFGGRRRLVVHRVSIGLNCLVKKLVKTINFSCFSDLCRSINIDRQRMRKLFVRVIVLIKELAKLVIIVLRHLTLLLKLLIHDDLAASIDILESHRNKEFSLVWLLAITCLQVNLVTLLMKQLDLLL